MRCHPFCLPRFTVVEAPLIIANANSLLILVPVDLKREGNISTVSYTHLTLPTSDLV